MKLALAKSLLENSHFLTTGAELVALQEVQAPGTWTLPEFKGRLTEIRGTESSAALSAVIPLIAEAQQEMEPVVWVMAGQSMFYAPDVIEQGIDIGALVVVRVQGARLAARAADHLVRSGAFGLIILDLEEDRVLPDAMQNRLSHGAQTHQTAVVCLTRTAQEGRSLGAMISLSMEAKKSREDGEFVCNVGVIRNKRGAMWRTQRRCRGPVGMR